MLWVTHVEQGAVEDGAHPFVRIPGDRVRALHALPEVPAFGQQHGAGACVHRDITDIFRTEPGEQGGLADRGMGFRRGVDHEGSVGLLETAPGLAVVGRPFPGQDHGGEAGGGGGVMDRAFPTVGQAHQLAHTVADHFLHLREGGAAFPGDAEGSEAGTGEIAQHRGQGGIGGEPAEMHRMLDLGDARHHDGFEVSHHVSKRLRLPVRLGRHPASDVPGPQGLIRESELTLSESRTYPPTVPIRHPPKLCLVSSPALIP